MAFACCLKLFPKWCDLPIHLLWWNRFCDSPAGVGPERQMIIVRLSRAPRQHSNFVVDVADVLQRDFLQHMGSVGHVWFSLEQFTF